MCIIPRLPALHAAHRVPESNLNMKYATSKQTLFPIISQDQGHVPNW